MKNRTAEDAFHIGYEAGWAEAKFAEELRFKYLLESIHNLRSNVSDDLAQVLLFDDVIALVESYSTYSEQ